MRYFFLLLFLSVISVSYSQQKTAGRVLQQADQAFADLRFSYAIPLYKQHLNLYKTDAQAVKKLALCYRQLSQYDSAIFYFQLAESLGQQQELTTVPELYAVRGQYDKASDLYKKVLMTPASNITEKQKKLVTVRLNGFEHAQDFYRDSADYTVQYLQINSVYNEFSPVPYAGGLVFESNRSKTLNAGNEFAWDGNPFTKLYFLPDSMIKASAVINKPTWSEKKVRTGTTPGMKETPNDTRINTNSYDLKKGVSGLQAVALFPVSTGNFANAGSACFTGDGNTMYFTRNRKVSKGFSNLEIWQARKKKNGKGWMAPERILWDAQNRYSCFHPAVTPDGKRLFFASDMPGGEGGVDIYYVNLLNDSLVSAPVNTGKQINTPGDEMFPTFHEGYLYFSSNGHPGLGGLDIFRVKFGWNQWTAAENLGAPVNSDKDDHGYYIADGKGFFSSNRYGSDDVFRFVYEKKKVPVTGKIIQATRNASRLPVVLYPGEQPALSAPDTAWTDIDGNYRFHVRPNYEYTIVVPSEVAAKADTIRFMARNTAPYVFSAAGTANSTVPMQLVHILMPFEEKKQPIPSSVTYIDSIVNRLGQMFTVYHLFDKAEYRKADEVVIQRVIRLLRNRASLWLQIVSTADCKGSLEYNYKLSERRAKYVYSRFPADLQKRIRLRWVSKVELRQPCEEKRGYNVEDQEKNRYTYLFTTDTPLPDGAEMVSGTSNFPRLKVRDAASGKETLLDFSNKPNVEVPRAIAKKIQTGPGKVDPLVVPLSVILQPGTETIKNDPAITAMLNRVNKQPVYIKTRSDSVLVELYDNGVFDKDSISVFFDKKIQVYKKELRTNMPISFYVKLNADTQRNELLMVAENMGLLPPNSALMIITDQDHKRNEVYVTSDLLTNAVVYLIKEN